MIQQGVKHLHYIYQMTKNLITEQGTSDPFEICENLKIRVRFCSDFHKLCGMIAYVLEKPVLLLNSNMNDQRLYETCAHELGHYLLHSDIVKTGHLEEFEIYNMNDKTEYQANIFAAHLLIDEKDMLNLLQEGKDVFETAMCLKINPILLNIKMTDMNRMGYQFPTSWEGTRLF